ncbi:MAG: hypothetical protein IJJ96_05670 [Bacteroidales bacterium]|nr:hypothetical protein [Bacteroidales bacterium]
MRLSKRFLLIAAALAVVSFSAMAQTRDYRGKGYKGSVSITDQLGVFVGAETSHGYMFDRHNYLGVGAGGFVFPNSSHPTFLNIFVDYHNFLLDKASTPILGLKAGGSHSFYNNGNIKFNNAVVIEPSTGWSWGLKSGNGLTLGLGAALYIPVSESMTDQKVLPMPKLSFGFEF